MKANRSLFWFLLKRFDPAVLPIGRMSLRPEQLGQMFRAVWTPAKRPFANKAQGVPSFSSGSFGNGLRGTAWPKATGTDHTASRK
jgi:hypothetical protein